jgi:hypothetical protein
MRRGGSTTEKIERLWAVFRTPEQLKTMKWNKVQFSKLIEDF